MIRAALIAFAFLMFLVITITLIVSIVAIAALALAIGIPLYLVLKRNQGPKRLRRNPVETLQDLFADGKIDLVEFERRVARLVAIEH